MKHYHQLTREQRYGIYTLLKTGHNQSQIAAAIGVYKSTISRELRRNRGGRGCRYKQAHRLALSRRQCKPNPRINGATWAFIEQLIRVDWSPEQISGWMKKEMDYSVSHEWIYQYILHDKQDGGDLYLHLPRFIGERNERNGMVPTIVEDRSKTGSVLMSGLRL